MNARTSSWGVVTLALAAAVGAAGCGGSDLGPIGASPTPSRTSTAPPTATPTSPAGSAVAGLVVLHKDVAASAPEVLGAPPAGWAPAADAAAFDRAVAGADWSVEGVPDQHGTTAPDGSFAVNGLLPGRYTLHITKTLDGNLLPLTVPFAVGDDGGANVVLEVSWGLVRSTVTYTTDGALVREIQGPYGQHLYTRDGQVIELGDPGRTLIDVNGDGRFEPQPCPADCAPLEITAVTIVGPSQLVLGRQGQVYASAQLSDGSVIDVTALAQWQSSDDGVADVDSWGTVSTRAIGTTTLTASVGTVRSDPWALAVVDRPTLQRISVQNTRCYCGPYPVAGPESGGALRPCILNAAPRADILPIPACGQVVEIGATLPFTAVGEYADGSYEDLTKEVEWQVVPAEVGDVVGGVFTARQAGTAQLTASLGAVTSEPTDAATVRVVAEASVVSLSIYADNAVVSLANTDPVAGGVALPCLEATADAIFCCCSGPLDAVDAEPCGCGYSLTVLRSDQLRFHATAQYDTGDWREVTGQVTWRSTDAAVAPIDADGVVTALQAGGATIDATLGPVASNPVGVRVVNEATLQYLFISQEGGDRVVAKGDQRFFKAIGNYDVGISRDVTTAVVWHSSDDGVGGFDEPGVFTARAAGRIDIWAEQNGTESQRLPLEVYETSELSYCDPQRINRAVWSDDYNRVTLESDCATYRQPGVATLRYSVTETQPHGGIFNPCLDLYVYQGKQRVRTIREQGCGAPFLAGAAPNSDQEALKYQLRAFWDLKDDGGAPVPAGTYTIYGRFYLYYDPVVNIDVTVLSPDGSVPTPVPTTPPVPVCTPPLCKPGEVFACVGDCAGGCGTFCVPMPGTPVPTKTPEPPVAIEVGSATGAPGERVRISVSAHTAGQEVASVQNDLLFDPAVAVAATADGEPDCVVNPDIDKDATAFGFLPPGCRSGFDCKGTRALVLSFDDTATIPDAAVLYTCTVSIPPAAAPGRYPLVMSNLGAASPGGKALATSGTDGAVTVLAP
jgi:hypothetical protein